MSPTFLNVEARLANGVVTLKLSGRLETINAYDISEPILVIGLGETLIPIEIARRWPLIIDLASLDRISGLGIGFLVMLDRNSRINGHSGIVIINAGADVRGALERNQFPASRIATARSQSRRRVSRS